MAVQTLGESDEEEIAVEIFEEALDYSGWEYRENEDRDSDEPSNLSSNRHADNRNNESDEALNLSRITSTVEESPDLSNVELG